MWEPIYALIYTKNNLFNMHFQMVCIVSVYLGFVEGYSASSLQNGFKASFST